MAADKDMHMRTHLYKYAHLHNDSEWVFFDVGLQVNSRATQARNITPCVVTSQKSQVKHKTANIASNGVGPARRAGGRQSYFLIRPS